MLDNPSIAGALAYLAYIAYRLARDHWDWPSPFRMPLRLISLSSGS